MREGRQRTKAKSTGEERHGNGENAGEMQKQGKERKKRKGERMSYIKGRMNGGKSIMVRWTGGQGKSTKGRKWERRKAREGGIERVDLYSLFFSLTLLFPPSLASFFLPLLH